MPPVHTHMRMLGVCVASPCISPNKARVRLPAAYTKRLLSALDYSASPIRQAPSELAGAGVGYSHGRVGPFTPLANIRRKRRATVMALLSLLLVCAAISVVRLYEAQQDLRTAAAEATALLAAASPGVPPATALSRLRDACDHAVRGADAAEPFAVALRPLSLAPPPVRGWGELRDVLLLSRSLCAMEGDGQAVLTNFNTAAAANTELGPALLQATQASTAAFQRLANEAAMALVLEDRLRPADFQGPLTPIGTRLAQLKRLDPALHGLSALAPAAPRLLNSLLGVDRSKTYLIVGQDNAEPRATGGFVGVMGPLEVTGGRVTRSEFRSSYDWDNARRPPQAPPQALQKYMNVGAWFIRDSNFWPDFTRTANQFETFWRDDQGSQADGVIAVDLPALDDLLLAVGGVDVPELGGYVTAGTAEQRIDEMRRDRDVLASAQNYQRAKTALLGAVYRALLAKVLKPTPEQLPAITAAVVHGLETKHLLLSFTDPALARAIRQQGWDGHLDPEPGESLGIFDTSVSYGKVGPFIHKTATYAESAGGAVDLRLTYSNSYVPTPGAPWDPYVDGLRWDWKTGVFIRDQGAWTGYIRVIVPARSRLDGFSGWDDQPQAVDDVDGFTTFAAPVVVLPGETRSVELMYHPPHADRWLRLLAQPGAPPFTITFQAAGVASSQTVDGRDILLKR